MGGIKDVCQCHAVLNSDRGQSDAFDTNVPS